jgi:hypothetical protein
MWINSLRLPKLSSLRSARRPEKPLNPRYRSYGRARIEIASQVKSQDDWDQMWKNPIYPYAFEWGASWKQCIEYKVTDFLSEVGFFSDVLGFPVNAIGPEYVQFTSPENDFFIAIVPIVKGESPTPPDAIRLQFNIADFSLTVEELRRRGIVFEGRPCPLQEGSELCLATFRAPSGVCIELFGETDGMETCKVS